MIHRCVPTMFLLPVLAVCVAAYFAACALAAWRWRLLNALPGPPTVFGLGNLLLLRTVLERKPLFGHLPNHLELARAARDKDPLIKACYQKLCLLCVSAGGAEGDTFWTSPRFF